MVGIWAGNSCICLLAKYLVAPQEILVDSSIDWGRVAIKLQGLSGNGQK